MIRAPFNFVPLSENVFFPDWADLISQDIPFEDGLSGSIDIEITAKTPIFVRNGHKQEDAIARTDDYKSFSKSPDEHFFIPGTSIKGEIRAIMEILSFSKMDNMADKRYSIRDLQLKKYTEKFGDNIHCGWMTLSGQIIQITDNGIPRRISHKCIDEIYNTEFCEHFEDEHFMKDESHRTAKTKYAMLNGCNLEGTFCEIPSDNAVDNRIRVLPSATGIRGTIVCTGQPGVRKPGCKNGNGLISKGQGKFYEFVFYHNVERSFNIDTYVENNLYDDFCFIYKDSEDWQYWRAILEHGGRVPVFFSVRDGKMEHFGLSYLYRIPFPKRIGGYVGESHHKPQHDLAECIFGYTGKQKSLKGRVSFSHAFMNSGECYPYELNPYMSSPRPTYYPMYIQQQTTGMMQDEKGRGIPFKTMMDNDARLRGRKRYPIQQEATESFHIPEGQEDNCSPFIPIMAGSIFTCRVFFHNLRKVELGALLTCIQLREGSCHSLGMAKPFGFGACTMRIVDTSGFSMNNINDLKEEFRNMMVNHIDGYMKSPQLDEFYKMTRPQVLHKSRPLEYMPLEEFVDCKRQHLKQDRNQRFGESLPAYSELIAKQVQVQIEEEVKAKVGLFTGSIKQARLVEGKDTTTKYELRGTNKLKLKTGDTIIVKLKKENGKIKYLEFLKKA